MRGWLIAPIGLAFVAAACSQSSDQRASSASNTRTNPGATSTGQSGMASTSSTVTPSGSAGTRPSENPSSMMGSSNDRSPPANMSSTTNNRAATSARASTPNVSRAELRQVQTQLRDMGLYTARVDGIWGPRTRAAVGQYQSQNNLPQSFALDSRTIQQLQSRSGSAGGQRARPGSGSQIGETPAAPSSGSIEAPPIDNRQPAR